MQASIRSLLLYLKYLYRETFSLVVYLNALIIGFVISYFSGAYSIVPFIVPCIVQIIARSSIKFKQRHKEALIELPGQKEDPVFIMGLDGQIILSIGRTKETFDTYEIINVVEFVKEAGLTEVLKLVERYTPGGKLPTKELFSGITDKWYEIKAKPANIEHFGVSDAILVWMQDITVRKSFDHQLQDLLQFSSAMVVDMYQLVEIHSVYEHLAAFMLKDYEAIFITRTDEEENLVGFTFKRGETGIKRSQEIKILKESDAPIFLSRRGAKIISDDVFNYKNETEFLENNQFDPQVINFIGQALRNFITYHEDDVSIIAFNYKSTITTYEKQYIEVLLNMTRTIMILSDLSVENQKQ
jgi:hypothetical protein